MIRAKDDWADPYLNRAAAREAQDKFADAVADLTKAIDLGYPPTAVLLVRSRVYSRMGQAEQAKKDMEEGMRREPTDEKGWVTRGLHRMIGTILGAAVYLLLAPLPLSALWLALLLGVLQFTIELVVARNYALALVFITPLVLLLTGAATGEVDSIAVATERVIDTLAGAALGALSGLLHARED